MITGYKILNGYAQTVIHEQKPLQAEKQIKNC